MPKRVVMTFDFTVPDVDDPEFDPEFDMEMLSHYMVAEIPGGKAVVGWEVSDA